MQRIANLPSTDLRRSIDGGVAHSQGGSSVSEHKVITGSSAVAAESARAADHREGGRPTASRFQRHGSVHGVHGRDILGRRRSTGRRAGTEIEPAWPADEPLAEASQAHACRARRRRDARGRSSLDLGGAIEEHKETARGRRGREASDLGLDWLFEQTLVLPNDFGLEPAVDEPDFDFDAAETLSLR